jgi:hypothetical protein
MENPMRPLAGLLMWVTVSAATGCAGAGSTTQAFWVRKDGGEIDAESVREARVRCEQRANQDYQKGGRRTMNIEWAAITRKCMDEAGYILITKPRE